MTPTQEITDNLIIQYTFVGIILLAICLWIIIKVFKKNKKSKGHCSGCSLADTCLRKPNEKL